MTTRDFITKAFSRELPRKNSCSSVFADSDGTVYSYGYHYPLLFRVNGKAVRNVTGYSNTTQRHIQWSRDVEAIDIHAGYQFRLSSDDATNLRELVKGQKHYIAAIKEAMDSKKRKDTQVYKWLAYDHDRAVANLKALEA